VIVRRPFTGTAIWNCSNVSGAAFLNAAESNRRDVESAERVRLAREPSNLRGSPPRCCSMRSTAARYRTVAASAIS
jgi:hypothetical protein